MLRSRLLCCSALALAVCGVGPAEGSTGELAEPASLAEQLHAHLKALKEQSSYQPVIFSQEMVSGVKAALDLVVGRLPEFVEHYGACKQLFKTGLPSKFKMSGSLFVKDYTKFDQDSYFLYCLGTAYSWAIDMMGDILELWGRDNLGSLDILAEFLATGIEAYRISFEFGE